MSTGQEPRWTPVYSPSASEVPLARGLLDAAGIPHLVENEHYAELSGLALARIGDAALRIVVPEDRAREARALLRAFGRREPDAPPSGEREPTIR